MSMETYGLPNKTILCVSSRTVACGMGAYRYLINLRLVLTHTINAMVPAGDWPRKRLCYSVTKRRDTSLDGQRRSHPSGHYYIISQLAGATNLLSCTFVLIENTVVNRFVSVQVVKHNGLKTVASAYVGRYSKNVYNDRNSNGNRALAICKRRSTVRRQITSNYQQKWELTSKVWTRQIWYKNLEMMCAITANI